MQNGKLSAGDDDLESSEAEPDGLAFERRGSVRGEEGNAGNLFGVVVCPRSDEEAARDVQEPEGMNEDLSDIVSTFIVAAILVWR